MSDDRPDEQNTEQLREGGSISKKNKKGPFAVWDSGGRFAVIAVILIVGIVALTWLAWAGAIPGLMNQIDPAGKGGFWGRFFAVSLMLLIPIVLVIPLIYTLSTRISKTKYDPDVDRPRDPWGKAAFVMLLFIIPAGVIYSITQLTSVVSENPDRSVLSTVVTRNPAAPGQPETVVTTTNYVTTTVSLGALDPALGKVRGFFIGTLIFLVGAILETALLLIYGAFYVNSAAVKGQPLGLPEGSVRVFILILVVLTLLSFALLPNDWGDNKAVVFLFGMLSTVVGFYYGSRASASKIGSPGTGAESNEDKPDTKDSGTQNKSPVISTNGTPKQAEPVTAGAGSNLGSGPSPTQ